MLSAAYLDVRSRRVMESNNQNQDNQERRSFITTIRPFSFFCTGFGITSFSVYEILENGLYLAERGNPGQLEGGLFPLLLIIGLAVMAYGGIEFWFNRN